MSTSLRVILFVASLCVFFFIMKKIKKAKLKIEYALFWIVSIMVLFVHNFYLTLRISNLDNMINSLTEEIAVRNYYKKEEENESK